MCLLELTGRRISIAACASAKKTFGSWSAICSGDEAGDHPAGLCRARGAGQHESEPLGHLRNAVGRVQNVLVFSSDDAVIGVGGEMSENVEHGFSFVACGDRLRD